MHHASEWGHFMTVYFAHTLEPGCDGEVLIRVTIDRAGEPVTLAIGLSQFSLPPGLAIALGNILISGGKCSIKGKHRQIRRAEDQKASQDAERTA
jgi:hypothetical protein